MIWLALFSAACLISMLVAFLAGARLARRVHRLEVANSHLRRELWERDVEEAWFSRAPARSTVIEDWLGVDDGEWKG